MPKVEFKRKMRLSRQEVADLLIALGNALSSGSEIELGAGEDTLKLAVAAHLNWELEIEIDGDETELEIEIKWTDDPSDSSEPAAAPATTDPAPTAEEPADDPVPAPEKPTPRRTADVPARSPQPDVPADRLGAGAAQSSLLSARWRDPLQLDREAGMPGTAAAWSLNSVVLAVQRHSAGGEGAAPGWVWISGTMS